jgi:hypothetical protein
MNEAVGCERSLELCRYCRYSSVRHAASSLSAVETTAGDRWVVGRVVGPSFGWWVVGGGWWNGEGSSGGGG